MSADGHMNALIDNGGRFLDWCETDAERVEFLRGQNDLLRHGMVEKDRLIDRAVITLREHGLHAEADDIERLASPW